MNQIKCLNDGFVKLVDHMGNDQSICNAARVSYGNHKTNEQIINHIRGQEMHNSGNGDIPDELCLELNKAEQETKDEQLIRYLMRHRHTTPFEMVSFVFLVRAPIHVARQWFRHRTWSYNEYSTRYKEAIDSFETTEPDAWRLQATDNKQGSSGFLPTSYLEGGAKSLTSDGQSLTRQEEIGLHHTSQIYKDRLEAGVAREQARKDLPLSTYTEFYAKVDLHNLFHFLSLRLDSHAQLEIRTYAQAIAEVCKPIVPISYAAFEDYRLNGVHFSSQEMNMIRILLDQTDNPGLTIAMFQGGNKTVNMSDREWEEFLGKLQ